MCSSDFKCALFAAIFWANPFAAVAADGPAVLREPVLGLRYQASLVRFDRLPAQATAKCRTLIDNENSRAVWYVFASTRDASGKTYYVIGGYEMRRDAPPYLKYDTGGLGVVFSVDANNCNIIDSARQVFNDRVFNDELPRHVLAQLAKDHVQRLTQAFGGPERLRAEMRSQHVDQEPLPPELAESLQQFVAPARAATKK